MRVSDTDREATVDRLQAAHGEGMLALPELDARIAAAWQAATRGDLAKLTADLPLGQLAPRPAANVRPSRPRPVARRRTPTALLVLGTIWLSIVVVNLVVWGIVCVTTGQLVYLWPLWLAVPGAALGVVWWSVMSFRRNEGA